MHAKISRYTVPELDVFRALCNFTPDERLFFDLRAQDLDLIGVKEQMRNQGHS